MYFFYKNKNNKKIVSALLAVFIFVQVAGVLWPWTPAKALFGTDAAMIISYEKMEKVLYSATVGALINSASYFARKLAYDSAKFIASGGKGKSPLFYVEDFTAYVTNVAGDSLATAVEEFGKPFGLNLCSPSVDLKVQLQIGLRSLYGGSSGSGGPKPTCTLQELKNGWNPENFEKKYGPGGSKLLADTFSNGISVKESDFGIALFSVAKVDRIVAQKTYGGTLDRQESQGFKPLVDAISGKVKTPGQQVKSEAEALTAKHQGEQSLDQIRGIYASQSASIVPMAASVFLNTLAGDLLKKVMTIGLGGGSSGGNSSVGGNTEAGSYYGTGVADNLKAAERAFTFLFTTAPQKQLNNYDIISEFASCPSNPGLNNCVIDTGLQTAIAEARNNRPVTIREAMDEKRGWLHGDWPLISPKRETDNTSKDCYLDNKYCYSNIQKLRKARILPLGFEIAALRADPDNLQGWTLKKVVDNFENCPDENGQGGSPYCHLIDPNWIIKAPDMRCEARVFGSLFSDYDLGTRNEDCVDVSTCVLEDGKGGCLGQYGYCLREKNTWNIDSETCPSYYNTCTAYSSRDGGLSSYLSRTLDFGGCTAENVGCLAYSIEKNGTNDAWLASGLADNVLKWSLGAYQAQNQAIYFNESIKSQTCSRPENNGCEAFYVGVKENNNYKKYLDENGREVLIHLKKAPEYLGCYDTNIGTPSTEWPKNKVDLNQLAERPEQCKDFANACLPEEVGCDIYTPASGGPSVPGVAGSGQCDARCNGYNVYKQEGAGIFEPEKYPLYFIPGEAKECSESQVGCDEFTNIDELAKGGEALEYYTSIKYCERPTADNEGTYYSWEGREDTGYVLRVHKMLKISQAENDYLSSLELSWGQMTGAEQVQFFATGSPAYADDSQEQIQNNIDSCNPRNYKNLLDDPNNYALDKADPSCRALYDKNGNIYYRLLEKTVTVSADCHPLRKTESYLTIDQAATTAGQSICEDKGGLWADSAADAVNAPVCQRCTGGGVYQGGACMYWTIKSESASCLAAANGCRAYTGSTAGDMQEVFFDGFEGGAEVVSSWGGEGALSLSSESIQVGLHSLRVSGGHAWRNIASSTLKNGDWFELSFWAKGPGNDKIGIDLQQGSAHGASFMVNPANKQATYLSFGEEWREYKVGPVQFISTGSEPVKINFFSFNSTNKPYYLDNVRLTKIQNSLFKIKNSWKKDYDGTGKAQDVPKACDENPNDVYPGKALGCAEYKTSDGEPIYLTGFDRLCRQEAVGCLALYDTFNTLKGGNAAERQAYNVLCKKSAPVSVATNCGKEINGRLYSCRIEPGKDSCYIVDDSGKKAPVVLPSDYTANDSGEIIKIGLGLDSQSNIDDLLSKIDREIGEISTDMAIIDNIIESTGAGSLLYSYQANQFGAIENIIPLVASASDATILENNLNLLENRMDNLRGIANFSTRPLLAISQRSLINNNISQSLSRTSQTRDTVLSRDIQTISSEDRGLVNSEIVSGSGSVSEVISLLKSSLRVDSSRPSIIAATTTISAATLDILSQINALTASAAGLGQVATTTSQQISSLLSALRVAGETIGAVNNGFNFNGSISGIFGTGAGAEIINSQLDAMADNLQLIQNGLNIQLDDSLYITDSTVVIPADTPLVSPIFLTQRSDTICDAYYRGCQEVGVETKVLPGTDQSSYAHSETFIINNPDNYPQTLCDNSLVGCEQFSAGDSISYFKDPAKLGNKFCVYKTAEETGDKNSFGWFINDLGKCSGGSNSGNLCKEANDCPGGACDNKGNVPCYENYQQNGGENGLWSNSAPEYEGNVGICKPQYDECKELVDPLDRSADYPGGRPYYVIFNNTIQDKVDECDGKVSQKEGCVLFDATENPNKKYDAAGTYYASEHLPGLEKYGLVEPAITRNNDSNIILKVDRTRTCSEWLACRTAGTKINNSGGQQKTCYDYNVCKETTAGVECTKWGAIDEDELGVSSGLLDYNKYIGRDTSWYGNEYSGYSLFNRYPLYTLSRFRMEDAGGLQAPYLYHYDSNDDSCGATNNTRCGANNAGLCFDKKCLYPVDGKFSVQNNNVQSGGVGLNCKGYPEETSPLPETVVANKDNGGAQTYTDSAGNTSRREVRSVVEPYKASMGVCQTAEDCSCKYNKVTYKDGRVDYWPISQDTSAIALGVCSGGQTDGQPCQTDAECQENGASGICQLKQKTEKYLGLDGFCLEYDLSRPLVNQSQKYACLTWLPYDVGGSAGGIDKENNDPKTGYYPPIDAGSTGPNSFGGQVYCSSVTGNGKLSYHKNYYDSEINLGDFLTDTKVSDFGNTSLMDTLGNLCLGYTNGTEKEYADAPTYCCISADCSTNHPSEISQVMLWPFNLVNVLPCNGDYTKTMYNLLLNWAAYEITDWEKQPRGGPGDPQEDLWYAKVDEEKIDPSVAVLYIRKPTQWFRLIEKNNSSLSEGFGLWQYPNGLYEQDIAKLSFAGPALPHTEGETALGADLLENLPAPFEKYYFILSSLSLDFNKLRDLGKEDTNQFTAQEIELGDVLNAQHNPEADNNLGLIAGPTKAYAFRGKVISGPQAGHLKYGLIIPLFTNPTVVNMASMRQVANCAYNPDLCQPVEPEISRISLWIDFDGKTGKLIGNLPLSWGCAGSTNDENEFLVGEDAQNSVSAKDYFDTICQMGDFGAVVRFNPHCTEFSQVYDVDIIAQDPSQPTNKAWTNRVWSEAQTRESGVLGQQKIKIDTLLRPYGSLDITAQLFGSLLSWWPYAFPGSSMNRTGVPLSCLSKLIASSQYGETTQAIADSCLNLPSDYSLELKQALKDNSVGATPINSLGQLFARFYQFKLSDTNSTLEEQDTVDISDTAKTVDPGFFPPQIYALNPATCFGEDEDSVCTAGEINNVTVNGQNGTLYDYNNDGQSRDQDNDGDQVADEIIGLGMANVKMDFFAFANKNHMPIKRVMINWGDGTNILNEDVYGMYKNHKPYCAGSDYGTTPSVGVCISSDNKTTGLTCNTDADCKFMLVNGSGAPVSGVCRTAGQRGTASFVDVDYKQETFDNIPRACEASYFSFDHSFVCNNQTASTANWASISTGARERLTEMHVIPDTTPICIFKPRVQVLDNWGWCNGDCVGADSGCYNQSLEPGGVIVDRCASTQSMDWVTYKGEIVVVP